MKLRQQREQLDAYVASKPLLLLIRHFAQRTVGATDTASDVELGWGGALAILAFPGAFHAIALAEKYGSLFQWIHGTLARFNPYRTSVGDEYFFLVYSLAVVGLVTVLRWDHLLPGRRDFANLAPLPLALRSIFLANIAAVGMVSLIFAFDVNAFAGVFFPLLVTMNGSAVGAYLAVAAAHWTAVLGISLFTVLSILSLQGLLMAIFPDALYRRVALAIRAALLIFFFALLVSAFVFPLSALNFELGSSMAGKWWPPLWFLSLYESLLPQLEALSPLGSHWALDAMGIAVVVGCLSFTLSYRRYFLRIAERPEGVSQPSRAARIRLSWFGWMARLWLRQGPEIATFQFVIRTVLRSETHLLFAGLWAGLGLLLSLEGLIGVSAATRGSGAYGGAILAAPLIFSFALMAGMRFVFDIPAATAANWLFQLAAADGAVRLEEVSKSVMLFFAIPPVVVIWFPFAYRYFGPLPAILCAFVDVLLLRLGADLLLIGYAKIPCTCSYTANRDRLLRLLVTCMVTLVFVIPILVHVEGAVVLHPLKLLLVAPAFLTAIAVLEARTRAGNSGAVFEDRGVEPFALLRLSGD